MMTPHTTNMETRKPTTNTAHPKTIKVSSNCDDAVDVIDVEKVVDVMAANGFVVKVHVTLDMSSSVMKNPLLTLVVDPTCTVSQLKQYIQAQVGIKPGEQRLLCLLNVDNESINNEQPPNTQPLLYGKLLLTDQSNHGTLYVTLQKEPWSPTISHMMKLLGYGLGWHEVDWILSHLYQDYLMSDDDGPSSPNSRRCYHGLPLQTFPTSPRTRPRGRPECHACGQAREQRHTVLYHCPYFMQQITKGELYNAQTLADLSVDTKCCGKMMCWRCYHNNNNNNRGTPSSQHEEETTPPPTPPMWEQVMATTHNDVYQAFEVYVAHQWGTNFQQILQQYFCKDTDPTRHQQKHECFQCDSLPLYGPLLGRGLNIYDQCPRIIPPQFTIQLQLEPELVAIIMQKECNVNTENFQLEAERHFPRGGKLCDLLEWQQQWASQFWTTECQEVLADYLQQQQQQCDNNNRNNIKKPEEIEPSKLDLQFHRQEFDVQHPHMLTIYFTEPHCQPEQQQPNNEVDADEATYEEEMSRMMAAVILRHHENDQIDGDRIGNDGIGNAD